MFFPEGRVRVHVYGQPVDMRKSFDGLYALTRQRLGADPLSGDLYVFIHVKGHEHFERDGLDLYCAVPISMTQAALGSELYVTTLDGKKIKVRIPSGMQNGKMLRVRDEGLGQVVRQIVGVLKRQLERAELDDGPGIAKLGDLVGVQQGRHPVAAQRFSKDQPGALQMDQGLTNRCG